MDQKCKVFVGNVPQGTSDEEFKAAFDAFGVVVETYLPHKKPPYEDQLQGFGFCTFADEDAATRVIGLQILKFRGQELKLSSAVRKVRFSPRPRAEQGEGASRGASNFPSWSLRSLFFFFHCRDQCRPVCVFPVCFLVFVSLSHASVLSCLAVGFWASPVELLCH